MLFVCWNRAATSSVCESDDVQCKVPTQAQVIEGSRRTDSVNLVSDISGASEFASPALNKEAVTAADSRVTAAAVGPYTCFFFIENCLCEFILDTPFATCHE